MKRIVIVGVTGSGKTTFGRKLAERTGIPFTDLDDLHWLPGWQMQSLDEFLRLVDGVTKKEEWIISGNYSKAKHITWTHADTFIFLEVGFALCFYQLFRRSITRLFSREEFCNGNFETFSKLFFSKESIFVWFFKTHGEKTRKYRNFMNDPDFYPDARKIILSSRKDRDDFLNNI